MVEAGAAARAARFDRGTWFAYVGGATAGYFSYSIGAIAPYVGQQLGLSDAEIGLHSTATAVGLVIAGGFVAGLSARLGETRVRAAALIAALVGTPLLALAPSLAVTLLASLLIGFGLGTILGYVNAALGRPGGRQAQMRLARGGVAGILGAFAGPALVAAGAASGIGWWLGLVPALGLLAVLALELRLEPPIGPPRAAGSPAASSTPAAAPTTIRFPRAYWLAWVYCVGAVGIEFGVVYWAAPLVQREAGVPLPTATAVATLFICGMLVGRAAMGAGLGASERIRRSAWLGLFVAGVGATVTWVSTTTVVAGFGLLVAGIGTAILFPLGVAAALATVPAHPAAAGARLTMASGMAILIAPFVLGAIAQLAGVVAGWSTILALVAVSAVLAVGLGSAAPNARRGAPNTGRDSPPAT